MTKQERNINKTALKMLADNEGTVTSKKNHIEMEKKPELMVKFKQTPLLAVQVMGKDGK